MCGKKVRDLYTLIIYKGVCDLWRDSKKPRGKAIGMETGQEGISVALDEK